MKCTRCGNNLAKGSPYCPICGQRFDGKQKCPLCANLIDVNSPVCPFCGTVVNAQLLQQQRMQQAQQAEQNVRAQQEQQAKQAEKASKKQKVEKPPKQKKSKKIPVPATEEEVYRDTLQPLEKWRVLHVTGAKNSIKSMRTYKERYRRIFYNIMSLIFLMLIIGASAFFITSTDLVTSGENHSIITYVKTALAFIGGAENIDIATMDGLTSSIYAVFKAGSYVQMSTLGIMVLLQVIIILYSVISLIITFVNLVSQKAKVTSGNKFLNILFMQLFGFFMLSISGMGIKPGYGMFGVFGVCGIFILFSIIYNISFDGKRFTAFSLIKNVLLSVLCCGACVLMCFDAINVNIDGGMLTMPVGGALLALDRILAGILGGGGITSAAAALAQFGSSSGDAILIWLLIGAGVLSILAILCTFSVAKTTCRELTTFYKVKCGLGARFVIAFLFQGEATGIMYYISMRLNGITAEIADIPMLAYGAAGACLLALILHFALYIKTVPIPRQVSKKKDKKKAQPKQTQQPQQTASVNQQYAQQQQMYMQQQAQQQQQQQQMQYGQQYAQQMQQQQQQQMQYGQYGQYGQNPQNMQYGSQGQNPTQGYNQNNPNNPNGNR